MSRSYQQLNIARNSTRMGLSVTELIIALMVLGSLVVMVAPVLIRLTKLQSDFDQRLIAEQIALNAIEMIRVDPGVVSEIEAGSVTELFPKRYQIAFERGMVNEVGLQPLSLTVTSRSNPDMKPLQLQTWLPQEKVTLGEGANESND